jgi:20S proteasome alpha/beta subunit
MTTIVGDWRRKILVSDSQYSDTDSGIKYFHEKVFKVTGGWFAGAGHAGDIELVLKYIEGKSRTKPKLKNENSFIWLKEDGLYNSDSKLEWETCKEYIAIGSGAMAAEALLRHGTTAEVAVLGACNVDLYSHEPVRIYELGLTEGRVHEES